MSQVDFMSASIVVLLPRPRYTARGIYPHFHLELGRKYTSCRDLHVPGKNDYTAAIVKRARDLVTSILGFHTGPDVVILLKKHEGIFSEPGTTFSQYPGYHSLPLNTLACSWLLDACPTRSRLHQAKFLKTYCAILMLQSASRPEVESAHQAS